VAIFWCFADDWYSSSVNLQNDSESRSEDFEIRMCESKSGSLSLRTWTILCFVALFALLGVWSFTHQVSYAPPLTESRVAVMKKIRAFQVIPFDKEIIPKQGSTAGWILGDGFTQAEVDGAWMTALNASINFSVESWTKVPRSMTLTFSPLLGPTRLQRTLTVTSGSSSVTKTITGIDTITVSLNGALRQSISISCDSIDSAKSLRVGPDFRAMCAKLISLVVKST
jgi:hypothetical protein